MVRSVPSLRDDPHTHYRHSSSGSHFYCHVERANLSVRTHLRRFTRLSLGFSKTLEHLSAAVNLYMVFFNFCRVHKTLRVTPAMQAGIADHVWTIQELLTWTGE